jgi:hypothetical protein
LSPHKVVRQIFVSSDMNGCKVVLIGVYSTEHHRDGIPCDDFEVILIFAVNIKGVDFLREYEERPTSPSTVKDINESLVKQCSHTGLNTCARVT